MAQFQVDHKNKAFIITLGGFAETEKASNFVADLKKEVAKIQVNQFTLIVDSAKLRTFKTEILPVLETSYGLYMSLGFKNILMVKPESVTPRLQLKRIAKKVNFSGEFIDSLQEALNVSMHS
ncbi:hypothetical protein G4D61_14865 [Bacillus ginsengihumi]|uniref:STAS domain-containing protein n=1 Tax=Heyndrickxia ginsengihumi TaxID=363870 RepID=A0A0A6VC98_9BACI|nr:hypothetical protein [Heyndrickxia ginsengihumi]KHD85860.1 hypothetical protein NG54_06875 [Heyndrickxia ginsengihumi]MBE6185006.1 hypothetical protein [Bacillus sp. (in: firmicutes)]MCM3023955.1 hypothetical protein [Heyndrickxia ginsengihumi]NEY21227.1 hypothetical protein [Heyndrickxia ginsengihumi]